MNAGDSLSPTGIAEPVKTLILKMLHPVYEQRPTIDEVFVTLKTGSLPTPPEPVSAPKGRGTLGGTLMKKAVSSGSEKGPLDGKDVPSKGRGLSGTLIRPKAL